MISYKLSILKTFMNDLLAGDTFDHFLLTEASIHTSTTFTLDGHINAPYYSSEEFESIPEKHIASWGSLKPYCYMVMKGRKLPVRFKIILLCPPDLLDKILKESGLTVDTSEINGLFLNIRFENNILTLTSGISLQTFTLDKTLDSLWDNYLRSLLGKYEYE